MKAIVLGGKPGEASLVTDRPYPKKRDGYILVDVKAIALNPTDWKHIDFVNTKGVVNGCDFAGVVAETGSGYEKQWKVGDRICGFVHGSNACQLEDGAFAERIAVKADIAMRIPEGVSFEEAATLGVGTITCGQGLFQQMKLNLPSNPSTSGDYILIYGGSSATGTQGIQWAKLAGYTVITICSRRNFGLVKSLGAVEAFDYNDANVVEQVKTYTKGNLKYAWDTISVDDSARICAGVISAGGAYGSILPVQFPRDDVKTTYSLGYTATGEAVFKFGVHGKEHKADFEFAKTWFASIEPVLEAGKIKAHPYKVSKGLENVFEGLDLLRHDKVSGQKLVYTL